MNAFALSLFKCGIHLLVRGSVTETSSLKWTISNFVRVEWWCKSQNEWNRWSWIHNEYLFIWEQMTSMWHSWPKHGMDHFLIPENLRYSPLTVSRSIIFLRWRRLKLIAIYAHFSIISRLLIIVSLSDFVTRRDQTYKTQLCRFNFELNIFRYFRSIHSFRSFRSVNCFNQ